MATIKSYTDLFQSRKLAEILPLESADMIYPHFIRMGADTYDAIPEVIEVGDVDYPYDHPCWSLASLLGVLPKKYTELIKEGGMYRIIIKDSYMTCLFDNPVDACVAMIEKLHELNLL